MNSVLVAVLVFACIVMMTTAAGNDTTTVNATVSTSPEPTSTAANASVTASSTKAPGAACNIQTSILLLLIAAIFSCVF